MQSLPLSGVVIVFSPQELAAMVVRKAVNMARESMRIPIVGVVENMSYLTLPDTGQRIELFGKSKGEEMAKAAGAPLLGQIPIDPELARLCDVGDIERYDSEILDNFAEAFLRTVSLKAK
jgi:Mrp family chromosome partitioning ATPase